MFSATPDWLLMRARTAPSDTALIAGGEQLTFGELEARSDNVAVALMERDVRDGDRVALLLRNGAAFASLIHAVPRAGGVLVPLNIRLTADEVAWQARDCGAALLIHDDTTAELARVAGVPTAHADELRTAGGGPTVERAFEHGRPHSIIYTSGTTGRPKGALLTFGNHFWSAAAAAQNLGWSKSDRLLACLPMFHVGGMSVVLRAVLYGNAVVAHETFDAARTNQAIDDDGVTVASVVANMLRRMLDERGGRRYPPTLRAVLLGGGPASQALVHEARALGVPLLPTYGLTEAASQVATAPPGMAAPAGAAGRALPGIEVRIDGANEGEILVRGANVSPGYWQRPEETAETFRDGWLHTGDIGRMDDDGWLYVLDRRDDLIVSGGENVYPAEVEAALLEHPDVAEAGACGVADERWGAAPAACVRLREAASVSPEELRAFCAGRLARYKLPSRVRIVDALPRTPSGKLQRHLLRELLDPVDERAV
jgi:o-succinylbenzoate---CoA ligase